jgi:hypothetical protein
MYHKNYEYETTDPTNDETNLYDDDELYEELDHFGERIGPYPPYSDGASEDEGSLEDGFAETLDPDSTFSADQLDDDSLDDEAGADYADEPEGDPRS